MVENVKSDISAMMDGELEPAAFEGALSALREEGGALAAWRTYHLIGDALQGRTFLDQACSARVAARLATEPVLIGPLPAPVATPRRSRWFVPSALAASIAAVALVGWMALAPRVPEGPGVSLAGTPVPVSTPAAASQPKPVVLVRQPLTAAARDYLIAHHAYSPRNSLQGVAPYVRSVSTEAATGKP